MKNESFKLLFADNKLLPHIYFYSQQNRYNPKISLESTDRKCTIKSSLLLVICVDNNSETCQQIAKVLKPAGYRLILVNESARTLSVLENNR